MIREDQEAAPRQQRRNVPETFMVGEHTVMIPIVRKVVAVLVKELHVTWVMRMIALMGIGLAMVRIVMRLTAPRELAARMEFVTT